MSASKMGVIFLAGGKGLRFSSTLLKQFVPFKGKPLCLHAFEIFLNHPLVREIVIVCEENYRHLFLQKHETDKRILFASPGKLRQDSVISGFRKLSSSIKWVCTHDAVRPLITSDMLSRIYTEGVRYEAATFAEPIPYSLKQVSDNDLVITNLNRSEFYLAHTPQFLSRRIFEKGIEKILQEHLIVTDDVGLAEIINCPVKIISDVNKNIKITQQTDLKIAETLYECLQI